jgi:iron-hydrogenase subunit gamma
MPEKKGPVYVIQSTSDIEPILDAYPDAGRESLIPLLQAIQDAQGHVSRNAINRVGEHLRLPTSKIYGVATFYNQFRFQPPGRFHVQVCRGTACHVKGSAAVLETLKQELKLNAGQTSKDGLFSMEIVACIGACGLAPVICVNGTFHANLTPEAVVDIIAEYRGKAEKEHAA